VTLELTTLGDLKLVEKARSYTIAPRDICNITVTIKVSSTEEGTIFGNIVEEGAKGVGSGRMFFTSLCYIYYQWGIGWVVQG